MPATASGVFFLARQRPLVAERDGTFRVTMFVRDKRNDRSTEAWSVTWAGAPARLWWNEHGSRLVAGQPIALDLFNLHVVPVTGRDIVPEIHASILRCELAPVAPSWLRHANPTAATQAA
jgi:hypothetical protein